MLSQIFGNVIAATILSIFSQTVFFIVMGAFALIGTLLFFLVTPPEGIDPDMEESDFMIHPHPIPLRMDIKYKSAAEGAPIPLNEPLIHEHEIERECVTPTAKQINFMILNNKQIPSG